MRGRAAGRPNPAAPALPTLQLFVTLLLMFLGAMGAGSLPYFMAVREGQLGVLGALGGGLLVGTALAVIVPEGFHSFAEAAAGAEVGAQDACGWVCVVLGGGCHAGRWLRRAGPPLRSAAAGCCAVLGAVAWRHALASLWVTWQTHSVGLPGPSYACTHLHAGACA